MFKRIIYSLVFLFLLTTTVFYADTFCDEGNKAIVISVKGLVLVKSPGENWISAQENMLLNEEDSIKTGIESYCDIAIDESFKNVISLGSETQVTLKERIKEAKISKGRVFTILEGLEKGSSFEVRTPLGSGGARGTAWETIASIPAKFNVTEDTITVKGIDKSGRITKQQNVSGGNSISIDKKGRLGKITKISRADSDRLKQWSEKIRDNIKQALGEGNVGSAMNAFKGKSRAVIPSFPYKNYSGSKKEIQSEVEFPFPGFSSPSGKKETPDFKGELPQQEEPTTDKEADHEDNSLPDIIVTGKEDNAPSSKDREGEPLPEVESKPDGVTRATEYRAKEVENIKGPIPNKRVIKLDQNFLTEDKR